VIELKVEHFNFSILVGTKIWNKGLKRFTSCDMVFDTGASMTAIDTKIASRAGYSIKNAKEVLVTGIGRSNIPAKRIIISDFELGGEELGPILVDVLDFPEDSNTPAVLGMNIIKHFKVTADFDENGSDDRDGTIWLEPKFHIRTKIKLEEFNADNSRFGEWWVSSN
jgi:hypothetical protein